MRGEHLPRFTHLILDEGSSPHARGARGRGGHHDVRSGIIPACAGSTCWRARCRCSCRDHPRMRGEHYLDGSTDRRLTGSSPHARGALGGPVDAVVVGGIIPACAGSTTARIGSRCAGWDHPRMRGEHFDQIDSQSERGGSSPHARGARAKLIRVLVGRRIIPACAGSTPTTPGTACPTGDHPRMRGEHCFAC